MKSQSYIESFFNKLDFNWQDLIEFLPVGALIFDENWKIKSVNKNFINIFEEDWSDNSFKDLSLLSPYIPSKKLPLTEIFNLKSHKSFEKVVSFNSTSNKAINLLYKGTPIIKNNFFNGGILIVENLVKQFSFQKVNQEKELNAINENTNLVTNSYRNTEGIFKINLDGNIIFWANNAANLFKLKSNYIHFKFVGELFQKFTQERLSSIINTINKNGFWEGVLETNSIKTNTLKVKFVLHNRNNSEIFVYCNKIESTTSNNLEPSNQFNSDEEFKENIKTQLALKEICYWSAILSKNQLKFDFISNEIFEISGYPKNEFLSNDNLWKEIIHPDDMKSVITNFNQLFDGIENTPTEITYRIIKKSGEIVWVSKSIKLNRDSFGNIKSTMGSISDISESVIEKHKYENKISDLERLNNAKEKFISIISHDLKSPFTSIVGFAELIITDSSLEKDEIIDFVKNIKDASLHTVDLLNGLLDLTKLQTGRIDISPQIVNASYVANKTVEILSGLAFQKGLKIKSHVDNSYYITVDDNLIFQVFNNLVANSIKFTPNGGEITINAKVLQEQQKIEFTVKDTGVGIEEEDIEKLFVLDKKFTTLGTDGERGTGLGLSLVKEIIEKHGGQISVQSKLNEGSEFIFTLPITSPSILIIDGNQSENVLYSKLLQNITSGIEIIQANDEKSGLEIVKESMPMLIIFEHNLPNMKGFEFVDVVKNSNLIYNPSMIVLSKDLDENTKNSYKQIGISEIFNKPFDLREFRDHLDKITGQKK